MTGEHSAPSTEDLADVRKEEHGGAMSLMELARRQLRKMKRKAHQWEGLEDEFEKQENPAHADDDD